MITMTKYWIRVGWSDRLPTLHGPYTTIETAIAVAAAMRQLGAEVVERLKTGDYGNLELDA